MGESNMSFAGQSSSSFGAFIESPFHARGGGGDIYLIVNASGSTQIWGINSETGATLFERALTNAQHISVGPTGRVFVTRTASNQIVEIAPDDGTTINTYSVTSPRNATCSGSLVLYSATTSDRFAAIDEDMTSEQWSYTTGVSTGNHRGIAIDASGNSYWTQRVISTGFILKLNSSGVEQWKSTVPANNTYDERCAYYDGNLYLIRRTDPFVPNDVLVKMSASTGSEVATITAYAGGSNSTSQQCLCVANNGKPYLSISGNFGSDPIETRRYDAGLSGIEATYNSIAAPLFSEFIPSSGNILVRRRAGPGFSTDNQVACLTPALAEVWVKTIGVFGGNIATVAAGGYIART